MAGKLTVCNKNINKITAAAIILIVIAAVAALALTRSPGYLTDVVLRFMLRPDNNLKKQLVQEVGREKANELLREFQNAESGAVAKPVDFSKVLQKAILKAQLEEKGGVENAQYDAYNNIIEKYQAELSSLQVDYEQKLNTLVTSAKQEYRQLGNKNLSGVRELFEKYKASGEALEADCDLRFNASLSAMEAELRANSLSTGAVAYARSAYIVMKDNYREEILNKALEAVQRSK